MSQSVTLSQVQVRVKVAAGPVPARPPETRRNPSIKWWMIRVRLGVTGRLKNLNLQFMLTVLKMERFRDECPDSGFVIKDKDSEFDLLRRVTVVCMGRWQPPAWAISWSPEGTVASTSWTWMFKLQIIEGDSTWSNKSLAESTGSADCRRNIQICMFLSNLLLEMGVCLDNHTHTLALLISNKGRYSA